jgi:hypothetical protein
MMDHFYDSIPVLSTNAEVDKNEIEFDRDLQGDDSLNNLLSCGPLVGGKCSDCKIKDIKAESPDRISCITNTLAGECFICKKGSGGGGKGKKKNMTSSDKFSCVTPNEAVGKTCLDPTKDFDNV